MYKYNDSPVSQRSEVKSQQPSEMVMQLSEEITRALSEMPTGDAREILLNVKKILAERIASKISALKDELEHLNQQLDIINS